MTLTTKKSRPIKINSEDFRYQISTTKIDEKWNFALNITVQKWAPPQGVLEINGLVTRDFWLDLSEGAKWNIGDYPVVLPKHIARLVKFAVSKGWNVVSTGKSFRLETDNGEVFAQT